MSGHRAPEWVEAMNEDVVAKDNYWHYGGFHGQPLRYHGGSSFHKSGFEHNPRNFDYKDEHSLRSYRSKSSWRKRRNACCLLLLLLLGALIISIGVGIMVYYLISDSDDGPTTHLVTSTNASMPLLNVPYTAEMLTSDTNSFQGVAKPLCGEMDKFFASSQYADRYRGCDVELLRTDDVPRPCSCANITAPVQPDNVRAYFTLNFLGGIHGITEDVNTIIGNRLTSISGPSFEVLTMKDFIVDIRSTFPGPVTPIPPPEVGVLANMTIWVYNLTHTTSLLDPSSDYFKFLALPFCDDLMVIFYDSSLRDRLHSCEVKQFSFTPDVVISHVWFKNDDVLGLKEDIINLVLTKARTVAVDGRLRKIIGSLLITPAFGDDNGTVHVIPIPVNPQTTISPSPTMTSTAVPSSTVWIDGMPYIDMLLYVYHLDYQNPGFADPNSQLFRDYERRYCKDFERIIMLSDWKDDFYGCKLVSVTPPPFNKRYPYIRTFLRIDDDVTDPNGITDVIRAYAPRHLQGNGVLVTYRIGDMYVILDDGSFSKQYTPGVTQTSFGTMFTSFTPVMTSTTAGQTVTPSMSSSVLFTYNTTTVFIDAALYNFTYDQSLQDMTSSRFMELQTNFCNDMDGFFQGSVLHELYLGCRILLISNSPNRLQFQLPFSAPRVDYIRTTVPSVILSMAPTEFIGDIGVLHVGDLKLIFTGVPGVSLTMSVNNYTQTAMPTVSPTSSIVMTSTTGPIVYSATLADFTCKVIRPRPIPSDLEITTSALFRLKQQEFCYMMSSMFLQDQRTRDFLSCNIVIFRRADSTINFHAIFGEQLTGTFDDDIVDVMVYNSVNTASGIVLDIAEIAIQMSSCIINLHPVNYTEPAMTIFPSVPSVTPSIQPSIDILHCLRQPCENGGTCVQTGDDWRCICSADWTGRDCSIALSSCSMVTSACHGRGFCINTLGGYRCDCFLGWQGLYCDIDVNECQELGALACQNAGTCEDTPPGSYTCTCTEFFSGDNCEIDIDECIDIHPRCKNGASCNNLIGDYSCDCLDGWTGKNCDIDVNECQELGALACQNAGTCANTPPGSYSCTCTEFFSGDNCEIDVDECTESPARCQNGASCHNLVGDYYCDCLEGWMGKDCDTDVNECQELGALACQNAGTCANTPPGSYSCTCTEFFSGDNCEIDVDECTESPARCQNGASCHNLVGDYYCDCLEGWMGKDCDTDIDECMERPVRCKNRASCDNLIGDYYCDCLEGWTGKDCDTDYDECMESPARCKNGATCENLVGDYSCDCLDGWTGKDCDIDYNECLERPRRCKNGADCENMIGDYSCHCLEGWMGKNCDIDHDLCMEVPPRCKNGASCTNLVGGYLCDCLEGWTGKDCDTDVDECVDPGNQPCLNDGTCANTPPGSFKCSCTDFFTGITCETDRNECTDSPARCKNGASCNNQIGDYSCDCLEGWMDKDCDIDVDECVDPGNQPCLNDGTCANTPPGSFKCSCTDFFIGFTCETDRNECTESPARCKNGASCNNQIGDYSCDCLEGWMDKDCDIDVNECLESPPRCQNGATCDNLHGDYQCNCPIAWTGKNCDASVDLCALLTCENGGHCENVNTIYQCVCPSFWTGEFCEQDHNECTESPARCKNGASCNNQIGDYSCDCLEGWMDKDCDIDVNECVDPGNQPCRNGGTCTNTPAGSFTCSCTAFFTGDTCGTDHNECTESPPRCKNGASCNNQIGDYSCDCLEGWMDKDCDIDHNECTESPARCKNGASCNNQIGDYSCDCLEGWMDKDCDIDHNECTESPPRCKNGASCNNQIGDYSCDCLEGWMDKDCDIDVDECVDPGNQPCLNDGTCANSHHNECTESPARCKNGASCNNQIGDYSCDCLEGWMDKDCDIDVNECVDPGNQPCRNGGTCTNTPLGSFTCSCTDFFTGDTCGTDRNECTESPPRCKNGASCNNQIGDYSCDCLEGWMDKDCDIDVNECVDPGNQPCLNGGTCTNTPGSFTCSCTDSITGDTCETDHNECTESPPRCKNGASCNNQIGDYSCDCLEGWMDKDCDIDHNECTESPARCKNGASCNNQIGDYSCDCLEGWMDKDCDIDVDECDHPGNQPCRNGGTCTNTPLGSFTCNCTDFFTGDTCGTDRNECTESPPRCKNGASCNNKIGDYTCDCLEGWMDKDCDIDHNECTESPPRCKNGASCNNQIGDYSCDCLEGWMDKDCDIDHNECTESPARCKNGASCNNQIGDYSCDCLEGWMDKDCDIDVNECVDPGNQPCLNGGTCTNTPLGSFTCSCTDFFTGDTCGTDRNECTESPPRCKNGASCNNQIGDYSCDCLEGWMDKDCDIDVNECVDPGNQPCRNGGTCANTPLGSFTCSCTDSFTGDTCETDHNECTESPPRCKNGASCNNQIGDYSCDCLEGWMDKDCDIDHNECTESPARCKNGASCNNQIGDYSCDCLEGWMDKDCDIDVNECVDPGNQPCLNGGTCTNTPLGSFTCSCTDFFTGDTCGTDRNECTESPPRCKNGASCNNQIGDYSCDCLEGWMDKDCDIDVNECVDPGNQPCRNGGTCANTPLGSFTCSCTDSFTGDTCETDHNECTESPPRCKNGASCNNQIGDYSCDCLEGWMDKHCDIDVDECVDPGNQPCRNGGTCTNTPGSFTCSCTDSFTGDTCETAVGDSFSIQMETIGLIYVADLADPGSDTFKLYADPFCAEVNTIVAGLSGFDNYQECVVTSFENTEPRVKLNWQAVFDGSTQPADTGTHIRDLIFETQEKTRIDDEYGIKIGPLTIYHSDFVTTDVEFNRGLLNFNFDADLSNPSSILFQDYEAELCQDIDDLIDQHRAEFPNYLRCSIEEFTESHDTNAALHRVEFILNFGGNQNFEAIVASYDAIVASDLPVVTFDQYTGYNLGNFLFFSGFRDGFTRVPIAYQLIDKDGLSSSSAAAFQAIGDAFCANISNLIRYAFPSLDKCNVGSFIPDGDFVNIDFALEFTDGLDVSGTRSAISDIVFDSATRQTHNDYVGNVVADVLVYYRSLLDDSDIIFDGWILNMTMGNFQSGWKPDYLNDSSAIYLKTQQDICNTLSDAMATSFYGYRYMKCFVNNFDYDVTRQPDKIEITTSLLFHDREEPIVEEDVWGYLESRYLLNTQLNGYYYWFFGPNVQRAIEFQSIRVNISDYEDLFRTTTLSPDSVYSTLYMQFQLRQFEWSPALQDVSSAEFKRVDFLFCNTSNFLYTERDRLQNYINDSCEVTGFRTDDNIDFVEFNLQFVNLDVSLKDLGIRIVNVLKENANRVDLTDGTIVYSMGTLLVYDATLEAGLTNAHLIVQGISTRTNPTG